MRERRRGRGAALVALALALGLALAWLPRSGGGLAQSADAPRAHVRPGEVLVQTRPGASAPAVAQRVGATLRGSTGTVRRLAVPTGEEVVRARALARDPDVVAAAPNYVRQAQDVVPNDPLYPQEWALPRVQAPSAWAITSGSASVKIAILDSGVDLSHPDLVAKLAAEVNLLGVDPGSVDTRCAVTTTADDDYGHGTHVAGIAGAASNNGTGVAGVAWQPMIQAVKVLDCTGNGSDAQIIAGIDWAIANGAKIINLSVGGSEPSTVLDAAVMRAWQAGLVVAAAAGNSASSVPFYPAASPGALAVSATNSADQLAYYSNYGGYVGIAAPGDAILSTVPTSQGSYGTKSGTSMASPLVAGAAALVWSMRPEFDNARVVGALLASADKIQNCPNGVSSCPYDANGRNDWYGHGRLNVAHALQIAPRLTLPVVRDDALIGP